METMTSQQLRDSLESIPRAALAFQPTPLQDMPRLSRSLGGLRLLIKRDDMTGLAFGGNKARKLEYMIADAMAKGADIIVSSAAAQSNMLRMTAAACRALGLDIHLVMRGTGDEPMQGNLLLDHLFGAEITFIRTTDAYSQLSVDVMRDIVADLRAKGRRPYIIDMRYESGPIAALGYVRAAAELLEQTQAMGLRRPAVFLSTGSGTTQSGLVLGNILLGRPFRVVGISVQPTREQRTLLRMVEKLHAAADLLGLQAELQESDLILDDRWVGPGYGALTSETVEALKLLARLEGIVIDPVYSGKGLSGMIGCIRQGQLGDADAAIFIHTGGTPALFAYAEKLAPALRPAQAPRVVG